MKCCFRDNSKLHAATPLGPSRVFYGTDLPERTQHVDTTSLLMTCFIFYKTVRQGVECKRTYAIPQGDLCAVDKNAGVGMCGTVRGLRLIVQGPFSTLGLLHAAADIPCRIPPPTLRKRRALTAAKGLLRTQAQRSRRTRKRKTRDSALSMSCIHMV